MAQRSTLLHSTFLGGNSPEHSEGVAVGSDGSVFVVGRSNGLDYPITPGAFQNSLPGQVLTRLDATLSNLIFSTSIESVGTSGGQRLLDVAVLPDDSAVVVGYSSVPGFWPLTPGAFDSTWNGQEDPVITRIDASGSTLLASTYFGGVGGDKASAVAVDSGGVITIVGSTRSIASFPVTAGAFATQTGADSDDFVARLSPDGKQLWYSTFLGGSGSEADLSNAHPALTLLPDGSAIIVGLTFSADFPVTPGTIDTTLGGAEDTYVAKLSMLPQGVERVGDSTHGCAGFLAMGVTAMPRPGSRFGLTCTNAPPRSTQGVLVLGFGVLSNALKVKGAGLWVDPSLPLLLIPVSSNGLGFCWLDSTLPNDPLLVGAGFATQFFWPDACVTPGTHASSNALWSIVQP